MTRGSSSAHGEDDEELPRQFGEYTLLEHLARGGRGDVYVAVGPAAAEGRATCVIKCLRADLTADQAYVARFVEQARTAVSLHHPHIVAVVDVGRVGASYYLAFEHVLGRTLRELVERTQADRRLLPTAVVVELVCDLLDALDYAHRRTHPQTGAPLRFVHREVSPSCVMVGYDGALKLADIGLARSTLELEMTLPGTSPGRLAYQAPEQVRGGDVDGRADLFAVAVICCELLTGERWQSGRPVESLAQLAPGLRSILGRALEANPARRTRSCDELRRQLREDQRDARARPDEVRALMTSLYPGAAAASRRHFEALARTSLPAAPRGGPTVRFMPAASVPSAEAPTQVRDPSKVHPALADTPQRIATALPLPRSLAVTTALDDATSDLSAVTVPEMQPASLPDDDPQGPTAPSRSPAPQSLARPPSKPR